MNSYFRLGLIFLSLSVFYPATLAAQDLNLGTLSLQESIEIAQENSPVARANRYSLISSRWAYQSFKADLYPSLSLSGDAPNFNKSIIPIRLNDGTLTFVSERQSDASASISIDQNILPTGGRLSLSTGITRLGIFKDESTYRWQSTPLVIGLQQPLFQFNELKWRNRLEPLRNEIAQKEFVQEMEALAVQVTAGFFDIYLARINVENAEFNVARNDSIYTISQGRYRVGNIAENDLLQTELELRNAESSLTRSRIDYQRALNNFKILLGYTTDVTLDLEAPDELPDVDVNIDLAKQLAYENNSEALTYRFNEIAANRDFEQAKKQAGFSATLQANYGLNQTSENFSDLYSNPENRQFVTVGFNIPIFNWGKARAEVNSARNQQRQVANSIEYQRNQFLQEVEYQVSQFLQLKDQVLLAAQSDTIAQRRYDVAQNRYLIGKIDITNLFIAQNEKDSARQAYIQTLGDYWRGWYALRQLTLYNFRKNAMITYQTEFE
ncbi:TolC family protein [Rhodohalobacter sp. 8-1]|uniref:TolC family protein n=1 Tax=Rhodohalobacter sp. 8-1 TaxID=3131972 RepID=UPI0030EDF7C2